MGRATFAALVAIAVLAASACSASVETQGTTSSSSSGGGETVYCDFDKGVIKPPANPLQSGRYCQPGEICGVLNGAEYFSCCVEGQYCCKPPQPHSPSGCW